MNKVLGIPFLVGRRVAFPINPGAFRLFLAMLVFVHHFSSLGLGAYAVYVFFVLSGFWLQRMWTERYRMTRQPYLTYMISRVWRLAPVMILVSIITIMLLLVIGIPGAKVFAANGAHLTFSSIFLLGYSWLPYAPVGSAWSLDVEMQFYIVAPLLALAAVMPKGRWLLLAVAALCSLAFSTLHVVPILPKYIVFFMVGMVAAGSGWRPSAKQATVSAMTVILAVLFVLISPWRGILIGGATPGPLFRYNFNYNIALAFATVPYQRVDEVGVI
ncbi:acyltransferase family protein [Sphingomonas sp. HH69]